MRDLIKKILREELSPNVKRRMNVFDMDELINWKKQISFVPSFTVQDCVNNTIRKVASEIYPDESSFPDEKEYESSWDNMIDVLRKKYSDELTEYFTKKKEEYENRIEDPFTYTFVKHDEKNAGFSQSFRNFQLLVAQFGDWISKLDWSKVKDQLDKIDYFPNPTFTDKYNSNRMLISKAGDEGNNWGYNFSIVKSVPKEYLDPKTKKLKKNIQESK